MMIAELEEIMTTNQEKKQQIKNYLHHNPTVEIEAGSTYKVTINNPNRGTTEHYIIGGHYLPTFFEACISDQDPYQYIEDEAGDITHMEIFQCLDGLQPGLIPIDKAPTLYEIAAGTLADDERLTVEKVPEEYVIGEDVIYDAERESFSTCHQGINAKLISVEDVISDTASIKESAEKIYSRCEDIIHKTDLSEYSKERLTVELEEAAEYIEEYYQ